MKTRIVLVLAVVVLAPVFVATQNQPSGAKKRDNTQQANPAVPVSVNCDCASQAGDGKDKPQGWHKLVTWPEGIAVWALIATLGAIIYQAILTHLSVRVARDALIASERPELEVKHVSLAIQSLDDRDWKIGCIVANVGGTNATIIESDLTISRITVGTLESLLIGIPHYDRKYSFSSFSIAPGERQEQTITLDANDRLRFNLAHSQADKRRTEGNEPLTTSPIVCFGFFRYRDERGIARLTGFGWVWNSLNMTFTRLDNPNYEYAD
jgi:hypothetical protein